MAKSKSKKKGNLNSQPSSPQIDNRGLYFEFFNLFDFKQFSKSLTFYVFLVCVVIFQLDRISEILWMGEIMNRSESSSVERATWWRACPSSVVERMTGRPADLSSGAEMTRRRTGHASIVEKKTTSSRGVKVSFISFYTKSSILTFTDSNITSFLYQNLYEI